MNRMHRMTRHLVVLLIAACARTPYEPEDRPYMTGVITSRAPLVVGWRDGDSTRLVTIPRARITDSTKSAEGCQQSIVVSFSANTPITRRSGAPADTGVLQVGQRVSVWTEDLFLDSCARQTSASRILVEDLK